MSERSTTPGRLPGLWVLIRDVLSFLGGWALIFMELQRAEARESVLLFLGGVVGLPVAAVGLSSVVEAISTRRGGTGTSSSPSPEEAPSERQPSP